MRPLYWGLIGLILGAVGWVCSVVIAVLTLGKLKLLTYVFGVLCISSLPAGLIWEILDRRKKGVRKKHE